MKLAALAFGVGVMLTVEQRDAQRADFDLPSVAVSADGAFAAFTSYSQLVTGDRNTANDVYVLDRARGHVTLESGDTAGAGGHAVNPGISHDGRYVIFERAGVWLRDRAAGVIKRIAGGSRPVISEDGRVVVFTAPRFDGVTDMNGERDDIYAVDLATGNARLISIDMPGVDATVASSGGASASRDGRYVAFTSRALTPGGRSGPPSVFVRDTARTITRLVGPGWDPSLSGDGRSVAFVNLSNDIANIYVADLDTGATRIATRSIRRGRANGASARPKMSSDGRFVVFQSIASNLTATEDFNLLWDVFAFDRTTEQIVRVSGDGSEAWMESSGGPAIDGAGSIVAFSSRHPTDASDKHNDFDLYVATVEKR
jgi:Tol biopolymer transport system component